MHAIRAASTVLLGAGLLVLGAAIGYAQPVASGVRSGVAAEIDRSRTAVGAPDAFRRRPRFASCGDVVLERGGAIPPASRACLAAGRSVGAELAVASRTDQGDLIVTFFRTGPGIRGVEVFADGTRDPLGPRQWSRTRCPTTSIDGSGVCA